MRKPSITRALRLARRATVPPAQMSPPTGAAAPGEPGQKARDADWVYLCVAPNSWRRASTNAW